MRYDPIRKSVTHEFAVVRPPDEFVEDDKVTILPTDNGSTTARRPSRQFPNCWIWEA